VHGCSCHRRRMHGEDVRRQLVSRSVSSEAGWTIGQPCASEERHAREPIPRSLDSSMRTGLRCRVSVDRPPVLVEAGAEIAASDLRCFPLHLPLPAPCRPARRATTPQRFRLDAKSISGDRSPVLGRPPIHRQVTQRAWMRLVLRGVRSHADRIECRLRAIDTDGYRVAPGVNADRRLCVRSMSASENSGRSERSRLISATNCSAGTGGLQ
jgi:hypothetical protein